MNLKMWFMLNGFEAPATTSSPKQERPPTCRKPRFKGNHRDTHPERRKPLKAVHNLDLALSGTLQDEDSAKSRMPTMSRWQSEPDILASIPSGITSSNLDEDPDDSGILEESDDAINFNSNNGLDLVVPKLDAFDSHLETLFFSDIQSRSNLSYMHSRSTGSLHPLHNRTGNSQSHFRSNSKNRNFNNKTNESPSLLPKFGQFLPVEHSIQCGPSSPSSTNSEISIGDEVNISPTVVDFQNPIDSINLQTGPNGLPFMIPVGQGPMGTNGVPQFYIMYPNDSLPNGDQTNVPQQSKESQNQSPCNDGNDDKFNDRLFSFLKLQTLENEAKDKDNNTKQLGAALKAKERALEVSTESLLVYVSGTMDQWSCIMLNVRYMYMPLNILVCLFAGDLKNKSPEN